MNTNYKRRLKKLERAVKKEGYLPVIITDSLENVDKKLIGPKTVIIINDINEEE